MKTIIIHDNSVVTDVKAKTCRIDGKLVKWAQVNDYNYDNNSHRTTYTLINAKFTDGTNIGVHAWKGYGDKLEIITEPHRIFKEIEHGYNVHTANETIKRRAYQDKKAALRHENMAKNTMTAFAFRKEVYKQTGYVLDYEPYSCGRFRIWENVTDLVINDNRKMFKFKTGKHIASVDVDKDFSQTGVMKVINATKKEALAEYKKMVKAIDKLD